MSDLTICCDCGVDAWRQWDAEQGCEAHEDFYVHDELWRAVCPDNGVICIGCFEQRLGRQLTGADFKSLDPDGPMVDFRQRPCGYYWRDIVKRPPTLRFLDRVNAVRLAS